MLVLHVQIPTLFTHTHVASGLLARVPRLHLHPSTPAWDGQQTHRRSEPYAACCCDACSFCMPLRTPSSPSNICLA